MLEGRPVYCYNLFGIERFKVHADAVVPEGEHQVRMEFAYDGGGLAKGGVATLFVDGEPVGEGRVEKTQPMLFSADETTDVGRDTATPVTDDLEEGGTAFNGRVRWVQIDLGEDAEDADNYITHEERLKVAMSVQ
jgi:arylsulfatase